MKGIEMMLPFLSEKQIVAASELTKEDIAADFQGFLQEFQTLVSDEEVVEQQIPQIPLENQEEQVEITSEPDELTSDDVMEIIAELVGHPSQGELDIGWTEAEEKEELAIEDRQDIDISDEAYDKVLIVLQDVQSVFQHLFVGDGKTSKQMANQLLPLLEQWSGLKQQTGSETTNKVMTETLSKEEKAIWEQLISRFEKRQFFSGQNIYQQNAGVTKSDVMNWLQSAMTQYSDANQSVIHEAPETPLASANVPMSQVEQHTIHVQGSDRVEKVDQAFIEKFSNVMKESQFLQRRTQQMELSIVLKPTNLGHMTVRMMQTDGEMMVKILVTSQVAKDMMETNIHQLKHLFSPHQIMIERDESVTDEDFFHEEDNQEQQGEEDNLKDSQNGGQENSSRDEANELDFDTLFQAIREEGIQ